jgi:hypothetical protein
MSHADRRALGCALMCAAFLVMIMLLGGCATKPWPHFTGLPWPGASDSCEPRCAA